MIAPTDAKSTYNRHVIYQEPPAWRPAPGEFGTLGQTIRTLGMTLDTVRDHGETTSTAWATSFQIVHKREFVELQTPVEDAFERQQAVSRRKLAAAIERIQSIKISDEGVDG